MGNFAENLNLRQSFPAPLPVPPRKSFLYLLLFSIISLACIIYSDPRTHHLVFRIVLRLAKVKLVS